MTLGTHPDLKSFIQYIESDPRKDLPLKILGKKKPANPAKSVKEIYYSSSLLAEAYRDLPNPDITGTPVNSHFGIIGDLNSILEADKIYSQIVNSKQTPWRVIQGDIIPLSSDDFKGFPFNFSQMIVLNHSCDIYFKSSTILCCPVLYESEVTQNFIDHYKGKAGGNLKNISASMLGNFTVGFIGLPVPNYSSFANKNSERMLVPLSYSFHIDQKIATRSIPNHRLNYRGLAYLQQRLGMYFFRDVQDSDDCREM
jgi:hypothetical protein